MPEVPVSRRREHVRAEVERALEERSISSVKTAFKFFSGVAVIALAIAGWLDRFHHADVSVLFGLAALSILTFIVAFVVLEGERLKRHSFLLRELLHAEGEPEYVYESLLIDARKERDESKALLIAAEARTALLVSARELLLDDGAPVRAPRKRIRANKQLAAQGGGDDE